MSSASTGESPSQACRQPQLKPWQHLQAGPGKSLLWRPGEPALTTLSEADQGLGLGRGRALGKYKWAFGRSCVTRSQVGRLLLQARKQQRAGFAASLPLHQLWVTGDRDGEGLKGPLLLPQVAFEWHISP